MVLKPIYMLVNNLFFATKIVKAAQAMGLEARAFDSADRVLEASRQKEPSLVILDGEGLEKEAFRLLTAFRLDGQLSKIPRVGYLSHTARNLKEEMLSAGALQVYFKSEFSRELDNLLMRHSGGFPSRV